MNASENLNNINKYKFNMRILIGMIAILLIMTTLYMVFADSSVVPIIQPVKGVPYMYFELEHSLSSAQYKYYGYGYLSQFNFNSEKIDDYTCIGYYVIGQVSEYFHNTNASFIIGKENYSKPVDGRLKIIFIYEKTPYVSIPKCSPSVDGDADTVNIQMKKNDFENATDIYY